MLRSIACRPSRHLAGTVDHQRSRWQLACQHLQASPLAPPQLSRPAGAAVQDGPDLYRFTGKQLRALAHLMRRVGLMLWQQALLFPQHITKLGCLRLDDPNNLHEEEVSCPLSTSCLGLQCCVDWSHTCSNTC